ncbi:hypothetical protein Pan54_16160 [Rubinisphaera italica]|uniref:Uncharacterized protein n=1 Tax=Rubinisphaera italica TaxID=2527969 RepID=A0A5C5XFF8_9PLAN|nr:hypothetical protein Pan54_16160 [Rubinisphaera italica]
MIPAQPPITIQSIPTLVHIQKLTAAFSRSKHSVLGHLVPKRLQKPFEYGLIVIIGIIRTFVEIP